MDRFTRVGAVAIAILLLAAPPMGVRAANPKPYPGTRVIATAIPYNAFVKRMRAAISDNKMGLVAAASASAGAASRGIKIPGNTVFGVYRNDFAVRMLKASVAAGIEAPIRFYITENSGGTATLTYRLPTAVFAPYESPKLDKMAAELDVIFNKIAADATGQ
jgi:uncharacterized protein (DUF302 family)